MKNSCIRDIYLPHF